MPQKLNSLCAQQAYCPQDPFINCALTLNIPLIETNGWRQSAECHLRYIIICLPTILMCSETPIQCMLRAGHSNMCLCVQFFAKCGILKEDDDGKPRVKLYKDRASGMLKGDGLVYYLKQPSVSHEEHPPHSAQWHNLPCICRSTSHGAEQICPHTLCTIPALTCIVCLLMLYCTSASLYNP